MTPVFLSFFSSSFFFFFFYLSTSHLLYYFPVQVWMTSPTKSVVQRHLSRRSAKQTDCIHTVAIVLRVDSGIAVFQNCSHFTASWTISFWKDSEKVKLKRSDVRAIFQGKTTNWPISFLQTTATVSMQPLLSRRCCFITWYDRKGIT